MSVETPVTTVTTTAEKPQTNLTPAKQAANIANHKSTEVDRSKRDWIKEAAPLLREEADDADDPKPVVKDEATAVKNVEEEDEGVAKETDATETSSTEETTEEAIDTERVEKQEVRKAWVQLQKAQGKLRVRENQIKQIADEYRRLQTLEQELRANPYSVVEKMGGSYADWQKRVLSGEGDPRVDDVKRMIEERDRQWQAKFDAIEQEKQQQQMHSHENNFVSKLEQHVNELPHCKALGTTVAVDMAHDFAEYVARAMSGQGSVPKSEMRYVERYAKETPKQLLLDPKRIATFINTRLAEQAKALGVSIDKKQDSSVAKAKKPVIDNTTSQTRATPRGNGRMSTKDWIKEAASQVGFVEDDD